MSDSATASTGMSPVGNLVLQTLFGAQHISSLLDWLNALQPTVPLLQGDDKPEYQQLLRGSVVVVQGAYRSSLPRAFSPATVNIQEVIVRVLGKLLKRNEICERNGTPGNLFATGYQATSRNSNGMRALPQLETYTFPTVTRALGRPPWRKLLQRVGEDALTFLFANCLLFTPLPNRCYLQLTGAPVRPQLLERGARVVAPFVRRPWRLRAQPARVTAPTSQKRPAPPDNAAEPRRKRARVADAAAQTRTKRRRPSQRQRRQAAKRARTTPPLRSVTSKLDDDQPDNGGGRVDASTCAFGLVCEQLRAVLALPIQRTPILYNGASRQHSGRARFPREHVLSVLTDAFGNDERSQTRCARLLAHHVFVDSALPSKRLAHLQRAPPLPRDVRACVPLLRRLLARFRRCNVAFLLQHHCPLTVVRDDNDDDDNAHTAGNSTATTPTPATPDVPMDVPSDESEDYRYFVLGQRSPRTAARLEAQAAATQRFEAERDAVRRDLAAASMPRLLASSVGQHAVTRFVGAVLQRLVPAALLGSARNRVVLQHRAAQFVALRRYERMHVRALLLDVRTRDLAWLVPCGAVRGGPAQATRARLRVAQLFAWLLQHVVVPLLANNFYVTESSQHKNQLFYYRLPVWRRIYRHWQRRELRGGERFEPVASDEATAVMRQRRFAFAYPRLLPKGDGRVRTIVNLGRKPSAYERQLCAMSETYARSTNSTLSGAHRVLQHEAQRTPGALGATVLQWDDVYAKLVPFVRRWRALGAAPLYVACVDIKNSFDSVRQQPLADVVCRLLQQHEYYVHKWQTLAPSSHNGQLALRFVSGVPPTDALNHNLAAFAHVRAGALKHAVLADLPPPQIRNIAELREQLRQHIFNNYVKDGSRFYRQRVGIPQGSVLSSLMCCLLYADLERHCLTPLALPDEGGGGGCGAQYAGVMLRVIDDFLYATTAAPAAERFARAMLRGFPAYGCAANPAKVQLNFALARDAAAGNDDVPAHGHQLQWCGFLLDTHHMELSVDYQRYAGAHLDDTLTVERTQHPGWSLQRKVKHTLKMRVHPLLLDENVTRPATARRNLFGACLLAALKLRAHARRLPHVNSAFLAHVVFGCVDYAWALLRALPHSGAAAQHGAHSSIRQREAECLSLAAFAHALAASPHRAVLARLRARLARARAACPLLAPLLAEECAAADAVLARRAPPQ